MGAAHSSTATLTHGALGRMSRMATLGSGSQHCAVAGAGGVAAGVATGGGAGGGAAGGASAGAGAGAGAAPRCRSVGSSLAAASAIRARRPETRQVSETCGNVPKRTETLAERKRVETSCFGTFLGLALGLSRASQGERRRTRVEVVRRGADHTRSTSCRAATQARDGCTAAGNAHIRRCR